MMLNEFQKAAVFHPVGPLAINAGSGSGKSWCIIERVKYLVNSKLITPNKLYVATFTTKAAEELKDRLLKAQVRNSHMIHLGTLHSIFYAIYRDIERRSNPYFTFLKVCNEGQQYGMIKKVISKHDLKTKDIRQAISDISLVKEQGMTDTEVVDHIDTLPVVIHHGDFLTIYLEYNKMLRKDRLVDFDDMLLLPYLKMSQDSRMLAQVQNCIQYLLCDETQDNSCIQHKLIEMVTSGIKYTVVYDIKQGIYKFRGASPQGLMSFVTRTKAQVLELPTNYRSVSSIVHMSNKLIKCSKETIGVLPVPFRTEDYPIKMIASNCAYDEAEQVYDEVVNLTFKGIELRDMTILYRCHAQSRAFIDLFVDRGLPHISYSSDAFYSRNEIKTMISYLKLVVAPERFKKPDCLNILKNPTRYVTNDDIERFMSRSKSRGYSYPDMIRRMHELDCGRLIGAYHDYLRYSSITSESTTRDIFIKVVLVAKLHDFYAGADASKENDKSLNIASLVEGSSRFPSPKKFLQFIDSVTDKKVYDEKANAIRLMTQHASKGREFKVTFVVGVSDGLLPHRRAEDIEEERRLAYVALTRACDHLYVSYIDGEFSGMKVKPSKFLLEGGLITEDYYYYKNRD